MAYPPPTPAYPPPAGWLRQQSPSRPAAWPASGLGARVARLDGATVIPGLIDAHCHVCDVGYLAAAAPRAVPALSL